MKNRSARARFVLSMIIFGTVGLFVRYIPLPSGEIALYRAVMAAILIGVYLICTGHKISVGAIKKELLVLILSGVAIGINWILLFEAYKYTGVSIATLSYYFAPVIVTVVCPLLFKEKMTAKSWICFLMSTVGLVMITGIGTGGKSDVIGILFGLGAAVFYATVVILNKLVKSVDGILRSFWQFASAAVILLPYVALTGGVHLASLDGVSWGALLVVGLVHTGITYCLYFSSLGEMSGQKVAILSYIDPLVAVLVSVLLLKESMTVMQIVGGALILGFALLNELTVKKQE